MYQYENETLTFAGGRLLLRGVNGSGKSTAMNMLLPFLLTAQPGRIDAAGEQSGILRSWMLTDRDDAQPVGYLWLEFELGGHFISIGCGIKANRQSDNVTTWWFITSKRPGIDLWLVDNGVPLSAEALRTALDGDVVYSHDRRRDYRRAVERELFGGASLDQHIGLINVVRNPRVGDRIDVDLPEHLVDALPRLSETALVEAAQPLDDLEEHRRNVAELARTDTTIAALLDIYRSYVTTEFLRHIADARAVVGEAARRGQRERRAEREAAAAAASVTELGEQLSVIEVTAMVLRREISALEESRAYREGQQLEAMRDLVANLARQVRDGEERLDSLRSRAAQDDAAARQVGSGVTRDHDDVNKELADLARQSERLSVTHQPPAPFPLRQPTDIVGRTGMAEVAVVRDGLGQTIVATMARRADVEEVSALLSTAQRLADVSSRAQENLEGAGKLGIECRDRFISAEQAAATESARWRKQAADWSDTLATARAAAGAESTDGVEPVSDVDLADVAVAHGQMRSAADSFVGHWNRGIAVIDVAITQLRSSVDEAEARVAELAAMAQPVSPRLAWQVAGDHCLADLVDFPAHLDAPERAGLEAALEACGMLSARVVGSSALQLATGDLVAFGDRPVAQSLRTVLDISVPDHLKSSVAPGDVERLLDAISLVEDETASAVATIDGRFRVGTLAGRHEKATAEFVGASARRAALERLRNDAKAHLVNMNAALSAAEDERDRLLIERATAEQHRRNLPGLSAIDSARLALAAADREAVRSSERVAAAATAAAAADRAAAVASDGLHNAATTLRLPADRTGLAEIMADLESLSNAARQTLKSLDMLDRSFGAWVSAIAALARTTADVTSQEGLCSDVGSQHSGEHARLAILESSAGADYRYVIAERDRYRTQLDDAEGELTRLQTEREVAVESRAQSAADAKAATEARVAADADCEGHLTALRAVVGAPGIIDAVSDIGDDMPVTSGTGALGLIELVDAIDTRLPVGIAAVTADGVRQSLRQRRDSLGAGWDADTSQPDPLLPMSIEVVGPTGRATLSLAARAVAAQHQQLDALLSAKQDAALRELLQGLVAREVAEKLHGAQRLIDLMNTRLGVIATAHGIGVRLRWRHDPELEPGMQRMIELLSRVPDLRTDDDEAELRVLLSQRLETVRREQPETPYRQLIAETLDYRRWFELSVMLRRGERPETKLTRSTPLSEGEKKLVTYLPLFAAVAASCDAMAEQGEDTDRRSANGVRVTASPRFVLLDDAFAKVSEDNHGQLFGLLVALDLDLIATSERLWGTHAEVPELSITEVVRDEAMGVIMLEHYRWDGQVLSRVGRA